MAATVSYFPSEQGESHFWDIQYGQEEAVPKVPEGFPQQLRSPLAWTRSEIENKRSKWVTELDKSDIEAIEAALASFQLKSLDLCHISTETFVLPVKLAQRLKRISNECYNGVGFNVIQGLDPSRYSAKQNATIYAGIAAYVAPHRGFVDLYREHVLGHIVNAAGEKTEGTNKTPAFTNKALCFHSDGCEILALYAKDIAPNGGRTLLSSAWQVYNDLATRRPEILQTLADNWALDTFKDHSEFPPVSRPLVHKVKGEKAIWRFSRFPVTGFSSIKRGAGLPPPSQKQIEAIDAVQFMAAANSVSLPMAKGDIVFINDMAIMHARESFTEGGAYLRRHLLKLWLRDPEQNWPVPSTAADAWWDVYGPNRDDGSRKETWNPDFEPGWEDFCPTNG